MINVFESLANNINPVFIGTMCKCVNVEVGSYANQIELPAPKHLIEWAEKVNFSLGGSRKTVCVDRCLEREIKSLWAMGIITTGCCCGHGRVTPYIGVIEKDSKRMIALGYKSVKSAQYPYITFTPMSV